MAFEKDWIMQIWGHPEVGNLITLSAAIAAASGISLKTNDYYSCEKKKKQQPGIVDESHDELLPL